MEFGLKNCCDFGYQPPSCRYTWPRESGTPLAKPRRSSGNPWIRSSSPGSRRRRDGGRGGVPGDSSACFRFVDRVASEERRRGDLESGRGCLEGFGETSGDLLDVCLQQLEVCCGASGALVWVCFYLGGRRWMRRIHGTGCSQTLAICMQMYLPIDGDTDT